MRTRSGTMPEPDPELTPARFRRLQQILLDLVAREVVEALRGRDLPSVLLKGPAIALWLYGDRGTRAYTDIDLLVPPHRLGAVEDALAPLGFVRTSAPSSEHDVPGYETIVRRARDGVRVELHTNLSGVGVGDRELWDAPSVECEPLAIGLDDFAAEVLRPPARALLVVLHAAHHGPVFAWPLEDLERALEQLTLDAWDEAYELATRLEARPAFAAGLRLHPSGTALLERYGLTELRSVEAELRASSSPPMALALEWLVRLPGVRAKAVFLAREIAPPPHVLRTRSPLARRGHLGLATAYAWRPLTLLPKVLPALRALHRASRSAR